MLNKCTHKRKKEERRGRGEGEKEGRKKGSKGKGRRERKRGRKGERKGGRNDWFRRVLLTRLSPGNNKEEFRRVPYSLGTQMSIQMIQSLLGKAGSPVPPYEEAT